MCKLEELENELKELKTKCEEIRKTISLENIAEVLDNRTKYMVYGVNLLGADTENNTVRLVITFEDGKTIYIDLSLEKARIF